MGWLSYQSSVVQAFIATLFTYLMTALGSGLVFFSRKEQQKSLQYMMAFSSGIMLAASYFSLLQPALNHCEGLGAMATLPLCIGFLLGGFFIVATNLILSRSKSINNSSKKRNLLLVASVTAHNIPEGLAIGVAFGALATSGVTAEFIGAVMLAFGIGVQNFPEGSCVSLPICAAGNSKRYSFFIGQLSGFVEILSGVIGAICVQMVSLLLPWALAFSAGAMIVVVCAELVPASFENNKNKNIFILTLGFLVMMALDVALG